MSMHPRTHEQVTRAICAYLSLDELRLAIRWHLDRDLDELVLADNKMTIVARVVDYADRHGAVAHLAAGLLQQSGRPELKEVLEAWLAAGDPGLPPPRTAAEAVPAWALSAKGREDLVAGLRRGYVEPFEVSNELRRSFGKGLGRVATTTLIHEANALRCKVDPQFEPAGMIVESLPLYDLDELGYWHCAFDKACALGGRMLGALLISAPRNLYEANRYEIDQLLFKVRERTS